MKEENKVTLPYKVRTFPPEPTPIELSCNINQLVKRVEHCENILGMHDGFFSKEWWRHAKLTKTLPIITGLSTLMMIISVIVMVLSFHKINELEKQVETLNFIMAGN